MDRNTQSKYYSGKLNSDKNKHYEKVNETKRLEEFRRDLEVANKSIKTMEKKIDKLSYKKITNYLKSIFA
ncbi:hypothetical protein [Acinetobacter haemolyticus]|uniref:hypothetical protein n=1 Tax=Acinetobacter haemolyticus TaxID=29430 RepID=UPI0034CEE9CB